MAILKCKMCGGELDIIDDSNVVECEYCGSKQTIPDVDDEKKLRLYDRANKLRMACDYDKASGVYESIVAEFPDEAEAYWGLILCKYGIEYVDDPATGKKIPTCHRSSFDSVMEDSNFDMVMENADAIATRVYREEAKQFEEIRKRIVEISNTAEDYDIFICYKETAEDGDRTIDSVIAQDVYDALTSKGYKVFFARVSLEDKLGQEYEPYIFSALNTSEVMLVFGTDYEYFNAVWVKNEWSRFLKLMEKDPKKSLIPCYKNIDAYDMPKEFARLQAQDMGKVGAVQDLIRGIEKLIGSKTVVETKVEVVHSEVDPRATALVKRGNLSLENEDEEYEVAKNYFDQALNFDAENAEAYVGLFLVDMERGDMNGFRYCKAHDFSNLKPIKKYIEKDDRVSEAVTNFSIPNMLKAPVIEHKLEYDLSYDSIVEPLQECIDKYKRIFERNKNWSNALRFASEEYREELENIEEEMIHFFEEKLVVAEQEEAIKVTELKAKYKAFVDEKYVEIEEEFVKLDKLRQSDYENACELMDSAKDTRDYKNAADKFRDFGDYKDCKSRASRCDKKYNSLMDEQRRKEEFAAREERNRKNKKIKLIALAIICGFVLFAVLASIISKVSTYKQALRMYNEGKYDEAITVFESLDGFKDSEKLIVEAQDKKEYDLLMAKYEDAVLLFEEGKYEDAYYEFVEMKDFEESQEYLSHIDMRVISIQHNSYSDGNIEYVSEFIYDDDGKLVEEKTDNYFYGNKTYQYDGNGKLILATVKRGWAGEKGEGYTCVEKETYDEYENVINVSTTYSSPDNWLYDDGEVVEQSYEYEYYEDNTIKSSTKYDGEYVYQYEYEYVYDEQGRLSVVNIMNLTNKSDTSTLSEEYTYENGDKISSIKYNTHTGYCYKEDIYEYEFVYIP